MMRKQLRLLDQRNMDEIVEYIIKTYPGSTLTFIRYRVARYYPLRGYWRREIPFLIKRDKLFRKSLEKFHNKGRPNFHAWYVND